MLLLMTAVLLMAMGTYLSLAMRLFAEDKLAYVYDLNASVVGAVSEQTRATLRVLVKELTLFQHDIARTTDEKLHVAAWEDLSAREPDILSVRLWSGELVLEEPEHSFSNDEFLQQLDLNWEDIHFVREARPVPLEAVVAEVGHVHLENTSVKPDGALLTIVFALRKDQVIAAEFSHQRLLRIFGRSKLHETYLVDERGEVLAHPNSELVLQRSNWAGEGLVQEAIKTASAEQVAREFEQGGVEFFGAYGRVGIGRLWVLAQIPKEQALRAGKELTRRSVLFGVAILLIAFVVSIFFSRLLTAPIRALRSAAETIGQGNFDIEVKNKTRDEIGDLADSFEGMAQALKQAQIQLVQSEKLAAFGQLGAGITHEVKNPMTGIIGFAQIGGRKSNDPAKVKELFAMIEREGLRCRNLLNNFLKFARASDGQREIINLNEIVRESTKIVEHQLSVNQVRMKLDLIEDEMEVEANAPELQQVLFNLAINAQQAMPDGGTVAFRTDADEDEVLIRVSDDGPGVPEHIQHRIFEPFFTTKASGDGTGLGLSVSFGIVKSHGGRLEVYSREGQGTTFTVRLPRAVDATHAAKGCSQEVNAAKL